MKFKLQRRDILLITGFWLIGCAVLGVFFYYAVFFNQTPPSVPDDLIIPQATYTVVHTQVTAKSLQELTKNQIALWQKDAQLYSVTATWQKAELEQVGQPTAWTYRFFSPGQKRLYFVTANPDGHVIGTSHTERLYNLPYPIPLQDWAVDSPKAINLWLNHGGAAMLTAMPGIQVVIQLQSDGPDSALTWMVAGYDKISKNYHTVFINATTNEVIKIESSLKRR